MTPLLLLAALPLAHQTPALPVQAKLGPQGEIELWLVAKEPKTPYGKEGGEWKLAYAPPKDGLDLGAILGGQNTHALVATTLVSPKAQKVTLLFGTDDGGTLTLNGKELWRYAGVRGVKRDEDRVTLDLRKGENTLVLRVDQGIGGWGAVARLEGATGVESRVQALMEGDRPEIRMARNLGPGFDAEGAVRYVETNRRARIWNRNVGDGKLFDGLVLSFPGGFGSAEDLNRHFADHAAKIEAAYRRARAPMLARAQNPGPLYPEVKAEPGIRVMPGGRQFAEAGGKAFIPVGYNHNPDWTELGRANPLIEEYDPKRADAWCAKLQRNGVNLLRMMVETPPSGNLEEPVGTFSPEHMIWLDTVVRAAREHGIRLMLTPYDTFWMNLRADASPYWKANGGPLDPARKSEWYTDPKVRELQKRRNHWLIDRYGNLDTVFCWEPMNEADLWWDASPAQLQSWADDIVSDAEAYQRKRWGTERLFSISTADPMPKGELGVFAFRRKDLDLANTHLYIGASRKAPADPADVVGAEAEGVRHALGLITDARPYMDTENGPIDGWIADERADDAVFEAQSWAHLASGGAGSGLRWPYRNPHHLTDGMLDSLRRMRVFADAVDWTRLTGEVTPIALTIPNAAATGYRTPNGAILLVHPRTGMGAGATVTFDLPKDLLRDLSPRPRVFSVKSGAFSPDPWPTGEGVGLNPGSGPVVFVWDAPAPAVTPESLAFHDNVWNRLGTGEIAPGRAWPDPKDPSESERATLASLRRFAAAVDWAKLAGRIQKMETVSYGALTEGYRTPRGAILFARRPDSLGLNPPLPVTIPNVPKGTPRLWDTERALWLRAEREADGGVTIPSGVRSICAVWGG